MNVDQKKIAECYQPLFDLMHNEHGGILTISEMDEISNAVEKVAENLNEIYRVVCDVKGCDKTSTNNGSYWRDTGYWCLCPNHAQVGREGGGQLEMKPEAI